MKAFASILLAAGLLSSTAFAQGNAQQPTEPTAHTIVLSQESDLLSIASNGALNNATAGVQILTLEEQQAVRGGLKWKKVRGKIRKVVKETAPYIIEGIKHVFF